ncbi:unnamed protein product [Periconia digitata]|uniref:Uncharacterized protein n=1 Tax=Periconia digitata TaxID=1303443 RepID=A0A9W4UC13_9PLEO|nr:unnamed protein product [Periconia digitata]
MFILIIPFLFEYTINDTMGSSSEPKSDHSQWTNLPDVIAEGNENPDSFENPGERQEPTSIPPKSSSPTEGSRSTPSTLNVPSKDSDSASSAHQVGAGSFATNTQSTHASAVNKDNSGGFDVQPERNVYSRQYAEKVVCYSMCIFVVLALFLVFAEVYCSESNSGRLKDEL